MTVENISRSILTKVCEWAGIELVTPGSAVGLVKKVQVLLKEEIL